MAGAAGVTGGIERETHRGAHFSSPTSSAASSDQLLQLLRKGMASPLSCMATHAGGQTILSEYQKNFLSAGGTDRLMSGKADASNVLGANGFLGSRGSVQVHAPYRGSRPGTSAGAGSSRNQWQPEALASGVGVSSSEGRAPRNLTPSSSALSDRSGAPRSVTALAADLVSFARQSSSCWERSSLERNALTFSQKFAPNWNQPVQSRPISSKGSDRWASQTHHGQNAHHSCSSQPP